MLLIDEFIEVVDKRDAIINQHFGKGTNEELNRKEAQEWYDENIKALDDKIIRLANTIMRKEFSANTTTFIRVMDVYNSQEMTELYNDRKADLQGKGDGEYMYDSSFEKDE